MTRHLYNIGAAGCRGGGALCQWWHSTVLRNIIPCGRHINNTTAASTTTATFTTTTDNKYNRHSIYDVLSTMPKRVDLKLLQDQRMARKIKSRKYPPCTVYLQVLGSGATGAPRSLYVFTEQARYLFNCGEGTQRLAHEHKVKLSTMEHILITHKSWENVGGLPGMLLTLQDSGVPEISLHGPPGIDSLYFDTRIFLRFRDLKIQYSHYKSNAYERNTSEPLIVKCVPLWGKAEESVKVVDTSDRMGTPQEAEDEVEDLYAHEKSVSRKRPHRYQDRDPGSPTLKRQREEESAACKRLSIAYICRPPPKAGALKLEECVRAGVPPGPLLGELKKGNDITLENGRVVKAADVTSPDDQGPVFIVIEAPSECYLDSLLDSPAFASYQSTGNEVDIAEVVVHFTPAHVMATPQYQEWMARFPNTTSHMVMNDSNTCMGSEAVHRIQYKLGLLSDRLFPALKDCSIPVKEACSEESSASEGTSSETCDENKETKHMKHTHQASVENKETNTSHETSNENKDTKHTHETSIENKETKGNHETSIENKETELTHETHQIQDHKSRDSNGVEASTSIGPCIDAKTLLKYHIRPRNGVCRTSELCLTPNTYIQECYDGENFEAAFHDVKERLKAIETENRVDTSSGHDSYPYVTFLGTGSCIPNKTRNTSGILLEMSHDKALLMDCGEGTYGQLYRLLGSEECSEMLQRLTAVYVSHLHADHHIGFIRLLLARRKAFLAAGKTEIPKLLLLAPVRILSYLKSYHDNFESVIEDFKLVPNRQLVYNSSPDSDYSEDYRQLCSELDMKEITMTYVIHCPNSFGVSWTHNDGWKITYSGDTMPCQGLVHIGKDCDLLIHEATMEDELEEDAKIKTHSTLSQAIQVGREMNARHTLLTHFSQRYAKVPLMDSLPERVGIAFDNMKVSLKDLPSLQLLYEVLVAMFSENYDVMLEKTAKKRRAKEKLKEHLDSVDDESVIPPATKNNSVEVVTNKASL